MKVFIKGFNTCAFRRQKLQQYHNFLSRNGHKIVSGPDDSDVILIWTCAFRGDIRDYCIEEIKRYQKEFEAEIIVAGCLPDIDPILLQKNFSGRILYWRNDSKLIEDFFECDKVKFEQISPIYVEEKLCDNAQKYREENPTKDAIFHDQFLKLGIAEGCNYECSYCSERLAFPPFRSFPEDDLVEACRNIVNKTQQFEVVLLADNLGDYGIDIDSTFPNLIRKLKNIHPDLKFALNNFNIASFIKYFDDMVEFLQSDSFVHLNLPIQSASPRILKLMNRPYTRSDIDRVFDLLNNINFTRFDTHIIVGFPGETEEDIEETIQFIIRHKPRYVLINSYMESPEMSSARLPDKVHRETMKERSHNIEKRIRSVGIICNSDQGDLIKSRFDKMSLKIRVKAHVL